MVRFCAIITGVVNLWRKGLSNVVPVRSKGKNSVAALADFVLHKSKHLLKSCIKVLCSGDKMHIR